MIIFNRNIVKAYIGNYNIFPPKEREDYLFYFKYLIFLLE